VKTLENPRIGVFVCECGGNISDVVDVKRVVKAASEWENVVVARHYTYMCSKPGVELIRQSIKKRGLNRVVIACCTPKMHRKMFERNVEEEGVNPAFLEVVNIREQCSWVHHEDPEGATLKAIDLVKGAVKKVEKATPLYPGKMPVKQAVLVIGGGIAGITAALRVAEAGIKVYLVEKEPTIGGHMAKYAKVFPTLDCAQCILTPKMGEVAENPNVELLTLAEVASVEGVPGDFKVKIKLKPRGVDVEKCVGCGACNRVCPVETVSDFDEGLGKRKAIYIPFPQAVPSAYVIDFNSCTKCGKCVEKCPRKAINLDDTEKEIEINVGAIIVATGFKLFDLSEYGEYKYGMHPNVITALQMERLMNVTGPTSGAIVRPSDGGEVKKIGYVLCAGSRDTNKGKPYCSRVCCLYATKQALMMKEFMEGLDVWIHYIDLRAAGRRYEEFYKNAQTEGVKFVRGKVSEIIPDGDQLIVRAEDTTLGRPIENRYDLVVLCPPIVPSPETTKLAEILKIPLDEDGFVLEKHPKLDPVSTKREGIFACGVILGPKDIQTSVSEAEGAAAKAINFLIQKEKIIEPNKAYLAVPERCDACEECIEICPTEAISVASDKVEINEILCNGCGACIPACPKEALDLKGLSDEQLMAEIEGVLTGSESEIKILAFVENEIAYTALDLTGVARLSYPSSIRVIPVPSTSRLKLKHILYAFAKGADGIMFLEAPEHEGPFGKAHSIAEERIENYRFDIEDYDIDSVRIWFSKVYVPDWRKLVKVFETFDRMIKDEGPIDQETRENILKKLEEESE